MDNDRPAIRNFFRRLFSCSSTPNIIDRSSKMHRNGKFSNRKVKKRASVRTNSYSFFTSQQRSKSTSRLRTVSRSSQSSSASSSRVFSNEVSYHPAARKKIHSSSSFLQTEYHVEDRNRDLWSWITMGSYKSSLPRPASWYGYMGQGCTFEVIPLDKLDNPPVLQTFQPLPITSIRPLIPKACHDVGSHGSDRLWISSGSLIDTGRNILNPEESDEEEELNREVECYLREIEFQKSSKNCPENDILLKWVLKTLSTYPEIKIKDFTTSSWQDGFAFGAIIHKNRPDLIDWERLEDLSASARLDYVLRVMRENLAITGSPGHLVDSSSVMKNIDALHKLFTRQTKAEEIHCTDPPLHHFNKGLYKLSPKLEKETIFDKTVKQSNHIVCRIYEETKDLQEDEAWVDEESVLPLGSKTSHKQIVEDIDNRQKFLLPEKPLTNAPTDRSHEREKSPDFHFFKECQRVTDWLKAREDLLEGHFSRPDVRLDMGQFLLQEMQELRNELSNYEHKIVSLVTPQTNKMNSSEVSSEQDKKDVIRQDCKNVALDLKNSYEKVVKLWESKNFILRQRVIWATVKVIKSWDNQKAISMKIEQRAAIRDALVEDSDKLFQDGDISDPQLDLLKREMIDINKLFDDWNTSQRKNLEILPSLDSQLADLENKLLEFCDDLLPETVESFQSMQISFCDFTSELKIFEEKVKEQQNPDSILESWNRIESQVRLYSERLTVVGSIVTTFEEVTLEINDCEEMLLRFSTVPSEVGMLKKAKEELENMLIKNGNTEIKMNQLGANVNLIRSIVEKTRKMSATNEDIIRTEDKVWGVVKRWENCLSQTTTVLRSCEVALNFLEKYNITCNDDCNWMDHLDNRLTSLQDVNSNETLMEEFQNVSMDVYGLKSWLDALEKQITSFDISTDVETFQSQQNILKTVKTTVSDNHRRIQRTLNRVAEIQESAFPSISETELNQLAVARSEIQQRFDIVRSQIDHLSSKMDSTLEEFKKFDYEMLSFDVWTNDVFQLLKSKERRLLEDNSNEFRVLLSDVLAHGADLKVLSMTGQKLMRLLKECQEVLDEFRAEDNADKLKLAISKVDDQIDRQKSVYESLLETLNKLAEVSIVAENCYKDYQESVKEITDWLEKTSSNFEETMGNLNTTGMEEGKKCCQLINEMLDEIRSSRRLVEASEIYFENLLGVISDYDVCKDLKFEIEQKPKLLRNQYQQLFKKVDSFHAILVRSQQLKSDLTEIANSLVQSKNQIGFVKKATTLKRDCLDSQSVEIEQILMNIDELEDKLKKVCDSMILSSENVLNLKSIEIETETLRLEMKNLRDETVVMKKYINEVASNLEDFLLLKQSFDKWFGEFFKTFEFPENEMEEVKEKMEVEYNNLKIMGEKLLTFEELTGGETLQAELHRIDSIHHLIDDFIHCSQDLKSLKDQAEIEFVTSTEETTRWLKEMEQRLKNCKSEEDIPPNFEQTRLHLTALQQEQEDFSQTIEAWNNHGSTFIAAVEKFYENRATYLDKLGNESQALNACQTETIRRKSSIEVSQTRAQISNISSNYEILKQKIESGLRDLNAVKNKMDYHAEALERIIDFKEKLETSLAEDIIPKDQNECKRQMDLTNSTLLQLQYLLETNNWMAEDNRKYQEEEQLYEEFKTVVESCEKLKEKSELQLEKVAKILEFLDLHDQLKSWVESKEEDFKSQNMSPPYSEQFKEFIATMKHDMSQKLEQKSKLKDVERTVLKDLKNKNSHEIRDKNDLLEEKWTHLVENVTYYEDKMKKLELQSDEFRASVMEFEDQISQISNEAFIYIANTKDNFESKSTALNVMGERLTTLRSTFQKNLVDSWEEQIPDLEIKNRVLEVEAKFEECQEKIKTATEEAKIMNKEMKRIHEIAEEVESKLKNEIAISANKTVLMHQVEEFQSLYVKIEKLQRDLNEDQIGRKFYEETMEKIQQNKEVCLNGTKRLENTKNLCLKFEEICENFRQWIEKAEIEIWSMDPVSLEKDKLLRQQEELQSFQLNVQEKDSIFQCLLTTSVNFLDSCDFDKDTTIHEVEVLKDVWKQVNFEANKRQKSINNLIEMLKKVETISQDLIKAEEKIAKFEANKSDLEITNDLGFLQEDIKSMESELSKVEEMIHSMNDNFEFKEKRFLGEMEDLRKKLEAKKRLVDTISTEIEIESKERNDLEVQRKLIENSISKLNQEFDNEEFSMHELKPKIKEIQNLLSSFEKSAGLLNDKNFASNPDEFNNQAENLKQKLKNMEQKISLKDDRFDSAVSQIQQSCQKNDPEINGDQLRKNACWLDEIERMMSLQNLPSSKPNVVKAQIEEQKNVQILLMNRELEFLEIGKATNASLSKKIQNRFQDLTQRGIERMDKLNEMLKMSEEFRRNLFGLEVWLENNYKTLLDIEETPIGFSQTNEIICNIEVLQKAFLEKKIAFEKLTDLAVTLMETVDNEDGQELAEKLELVTNQYEKLVQNAESLVENFYVMNEEVQNFKSSFQTFQSWMKAMEENLLRFRSLSVLPEELLEQLEELHSLTEDVVSHNKNLEEIESDAKDFWYQMTDEEELDLGASLDEARMRFEKLAGESADLLQNAQEMMPLVQSFQTSNSQLLQWLFFAEESLQSFSSEAMKDQQKIIHKLKQTMSTNKQILEQITLTGWKLQEKTSGESSEIIETTIQDLRGRFYTKCEKIQRLEEQVLVGMESEIQRLLDWFTKAENLLRDFGSPSKDADLINHQIMKLNFLKRDILKQKVHSKNVKKSQILESEQTKSKVDTLDLKADFIVRLVDEKLEDLVQAHELSSEFFHLYNELGEWFHQVEKEGFKTSKKSLNHPGTSEKNINQTFEAFRYRLNKMNEIGQLFQRLLDENDRVYVKKVIRLANEKFNIIEAENRSEESILHHTNPDPFVESIPQSEKKIQGSKKDVLELADESLRSETRANENIDSKQISQQSFEAEIYLKACNDDGKCDNSDLNKGSDSLLKSLLDAYQCPIELKRSLSSMGEFAQSTPEKIYTETKADRNSAQTFLEKNYDFVKQGQDEISETTRILIPKVTEMKAENRQTNNPDENFKLTSKPITYEDNHFPEMRSSKYSKQEDDEQDLRPTNFEDTKSDWLTKTKSQILSQISGFGDTRAIEVQLVMLQTILNDLESRKSSLDHMKKNFDVLTENKSLELCDKLVDLLDLAEHKQNELEKALKSAQQFDQEIQQIITKIIDLDITISSLEPRRGLPATAQEQYDRFLAANYNLEALVPNITKCHKTAQFYKEINCEEQHPHLDNMLTKLNSTWKAVSEAANEKKINHEAAVKDSLEFHNTLQTFIDWLTFAENYLTCRRTPSRVLSEITSLIEDHKDFQLQIFTKRETLCDLNRAGSEFLRSSNKTDATIIKNLLSSIQQRWNEVVSQSAIKTQILDNCFKESRNLHEACKSLCEWLDCANQSLEKLSVGYFEDPVEIKNKIVRHGEFQKDLSSKRALFDFTTKSGDATSEPYISKMIIELKTKWFDVCELSISKQKILSDALFVTVQLNDEMDEILNFLTRMESVLDENESVYGDVYIVNGLFDQHKKFESEIVEKSERIEGLRKKCALIEGDRRNSKVQIQMTEILSLWDKIWRLTIEKTRQFEKSLKKAEEFQSLTNNFLEKVSKAEKKLRFPGSLPENVDEIHKQIEDQNRFMEVIDKLEHDKESAKYLANQILMKCSPDSAKTFCKWITIIDSRWNEVFQWRKERSEKLQNILKEVTDVSEVFAGFMDWMKSENEKLQIFEQTSLPENQIEIEKLINQHEHFLESFSSSSTLLDAISRQSWRTTNTLHINPEAISSHLENQPVFMTFWNHVKEAALRYDRRLKTKLRHLKDIEEMKNFDFEEWKAAFLTHFNFKKSRVTDFFKKMDKDADGLVERDDFVNAILNLKLGTSRLEVGCVADKYVQSGDTLLDWREIIASLHPDWDEKVLMSCVKRIEFELNRQSLSCTCQKKFRVFQVGNGKYKFGDSQKLLLVRVLKSTVMVRVGGGWTALEEFLLKNDPCRVFIGDITCSPPSKIHEQSCPLGFLHQPSKKLSKASSVSLTSSSNSLSSISLEISISSSSISRLDSKRTKEKSIVVSGGKNLGYNGPFLQRRISIPGGRKSTSSKYFLKTRPVSQLSSHSDDCHLKVKRNSPRTMRMRSKEPKSIKHEESPTFHSLGTSETNKFGLNKSI